MKQGRKGRIASDISLFKTDQENSKERCQFKFYLTEKKEYLILMMANYFTKYPLERKEKEKDLGIILLTPGGTECLKMVTL